MKNAAKLYSSQFYMQQVDGSARSAAVIVPMVLSLAPVMSMIDVGCGVAPWAAEFLANGVLDVWGVDGDYVDRSQLRLPADRFVARDLATSLNLDRTFDLAVCLEVAEHLPQSRASDLVDDLTSLAPWILFSAAVPGQGGTGHLNEQHVSYWVELFQKKEYEGIDPIRPWILGNDSVEWFYQQNVVMFVARGHVLASRGFPKPQPIIHQCLYERARRPDLSLKLLAAALPRAVRRSLRHHLHLTERDSNE